MSFKSQGTERVYTIYPSINFHISLYRKSAVAFFESHFSCAFCRMSHNVFAYNCS